MQRSLHRSGGMALTFEEFLSRRLTELLRFGVALCDDVERAAGLVEDGVVRTAPQWPTIVDSGHPYSTLRTAVVRAFLATSGGPTVEPEEEDADLATRLASLPARQRAAIVLSSYSGQTDDEVAEAIGSAVAARADLARARRSLGVRADEPGPVDRELRDLLDDLADAAEIDPDGVGARIENRVAAAEELRAAAARRAEVEAPVEATVSGDDAAPSGGAAPPGGGTAVEDRADPDNRADLEDDDDRRRGRVGRAVPGWVRSRWSAVAVLVLLAVVVSIVVANDRHGVPTAAGQSAGAPTIAAVPSPLTHPLPGTTVLGRYSGVGPRTVDAGVHTVAAGRRLTVYASCLGPGAPELGPVVMTACRTVAQSASTTSAGLRILHVTAEPNTAWRMTVVDEPTGGTTGTLHYPAAAALTAAPTAATVTSTTGRGTATVPLPSRSIGTRAENLRLLLTCRGSGVSFASADHVFDGQSTTTCYAGWSYEFDVDEATVPGSLTVAATASTMWHIVVMQR